MPVDDSVPPAGHLPSRPLTDFLREAMEAGTAGYPARTRRRLISVNVGAAAVALFTVVFILAYAIEDALLYRWPITLSLLLIAAAALVPAAHRVNGLLGPVMMIGVLFVVLVSLAALLGRDAGLQLNLIGASAVPFLVFGVRRIGLVVAVFVAALVLHAACWTLFPVGLIGPGIRPGFLDLLHALSVTSVSCVIGAVAFYIFRLTALAEAETEALLRNILPEAIAARLKARPDEPIADGFAEAGVLFSDLEQFVALARSAGPERTVEILNDLVRGFDRLAARCGVEKIKTIGDSYMAVSGVPDPAPDHLQRLARMALGMQAAAAETGLRYGVTLRLRIGLACGPVMAGVIGSRKFSYDVWGDAVNLASRLERTGEVGRIHVSGEARARLSGGFTFASRGLSEVRGLGYQETWYLLRANELVGANDG